LPKELSKLKSFNLIPFLFSKRYKQLKVSMLL